MNYKTKKLPGSIMEITVELTKEDFEQYFNNAFNDALKEVDIKGFRKGTAPRELAEKAVDQRAVWEKATNEAVRKTLSGITQENNWIIIDQPQLNILPSKEGLKYSGKLVLFPEIKLPDYKKIAEKEIAVIKESIGAISVSDDEIKKTIDWLRESRATSKSVNRSAKKGDVVDIDFNVSSDGKPLKEIGRNQKDSFVLGQGRLFPEVEEKLVGSSAGSDYNISVAVPNDYWKEDLRGKKLDFEIKVNNVLERDIPPANDEFAQALGKFKNVKELEENIKSGIKQEKESKEKEKARVKILEEITEKAEIDAPKVMIDRVKSSLRGAEQGGVAKQSQEEQARQRVNSQLVIYKIAEQEGLKPTEEELKEEKARISNQPGIDKSKINDYTYDILQSRKVFEFLERVDSE